MALRVASWNVGGLKRRCKNSEFRQFSRDFDIIALQETLVHRSTRQVSVPGFQLFKSDALKPLKGRPVGGLAFLVSFAVLNSFSVEVESFEECPVECLVLRFTRLASAQVSLPSCFFVVNFYVPPLPLTFDYMRIFSFLETEIQSRFLLDPVLIVGDFNGHSRARSFRNFCNELCSVGFRFFPDLCSQVPTFISHKGSSVIDFIFARGFTWCNEACTIHPFDAFGHRIICCQFAFPALSVFPLASRMSFRKHVGSAVPVDTFVSFSKTNEWFGPLEMLRCGVNAVFVRLMALILNFVYEVRPPAASVEPWARFLSFAELRELRTLKDKVTHLKISFRVGSDSTPLRTAHLDYSTRFSFLRQVALGRLTDATHKAGDDPGALWKTIRNFRLDPTAAQGLPVDALCIHFLQLFNRPSDVISLPFMYAFVPEAPDLDPRFTSEELARAFSELNQNVAPGPSGTGNDVVLFLRNVPGFQRVLLDLYNACLIGGSLPAAWKKCEMFLLYKGKGDPLVPSSYRAIALLDCFLKLYERLLFHRLNTWSRKLDVVPPSQFGFRPRSGTLDAVFVFARLIERFVFRKNGVLFAALIDFKSAFPSIDRSLLFQKLAKLGISSRFGFALHSLFEENTFVLRFDTGVTEEFKVNSGLREGSVLSPLLFSIFISDMEGSVLRPFNPAVNYQFRDFCVAGVPFPSLMYADDLIILARSRLCLKERLKRLEVYVSKNKLTVNVSKCEIVCFGFSGKCRFSFLGENVPVHDNCKYLGILFSRETGIKAHLSSLPAKFASSVVPFFALMRRLQVSNLVLLARLKTSLLLSCLYGVEFAVDRNLPEVLSASFRKGLRSYIGVPNRVSNDLLFLLFPGFSFGNFILSRKLGFLRRSLRPSDTLAAVWFLEDRLVDFPSGVGFSSDLRDLLSYFGLPELVNCDEKSTVNWALREAHETEVLLAWERMRVAKSTSFLCTVFPDPVVFFQAATAASSINLAMLRIFLVMWTGSVFIHLFGAHQRSCPICREPLISKHFFGCDFDVCRHLQLIVWARNGLFSDLIRFTSASYFSFLARVKPTVLSEEEALLLDLCDSPNDLAMLCGNEQ